MDDRTNAFGTLKGTPLSLSCRQSSNQLGLLLVLDISLNYHTAASGFFYDFED